MSSPTPSTYLPSPTPTPGTLLTVGCAQKVSTHTKWGVPLALCNEVTRVLPGELGGTEAVGQTGKGILGKKQAKKKSEILGKDIETGL